MQISQKNVAAVLALCCATITNAQTLDNLPSELVSLHEQITEVETSLATYDGGLIRSLASARLEALLLSRTLLETRILAEETGATLDVVVPAVMPDEALAQKLLGEMATAQQRVSAAEQEASQGAGLVQALALSRVETEKLTLAQLQMAYLQAKYGIAIPAISAPEVERSDVGAPVAVSSDEINGGGAVAWADPNYPGIDYDRSDFEQAHRSGEQISGWWTIKSDRAAIDDSVQITAVNYSASNPSSFMGLTALIARCIEGETALIFVQDDFLISDFRRNTFDISLRVDDLPAQQTRWNGLTSNKGAGLFGSEAENFIRSIIAADRLFIRLTERNGQNHDANFELAGAELAFEQVASACGWTTLSLSVDDYRAIQTLLNAGGFDAGTPDGQWGPGSQRAMRAFQSSVGLPDTGAPDRATLQQLGIGD